MSIPTYIAYPDKATQQVFLTLVVLLVLICLAGCAADLTPESDNISSQDYVYSIPADTASAMRVSSPVAESINETALINVVKDILDGAYGGIDSILIARNGALVLEQYFNGYHRNKKHDIRSATKSITGLLAGIAIDKGVIPGTGTTVYGYFTRYDSYDYWSDMKNNITVQHLLTMSHGWACNERDKASPGNGDKMYRYNDWVKFILDLPMEHYPGEVFSYCSGSVGVLGDIIGLAAGMDVADFAKINLYDPLNITNFHYQTDPAGRTHTGGQMHLTPLAMLKLGQLFLDDGNWYGNQIVSAQWISASKTAYFPWYSNLWWIWTGTVDVIGIDVTFYYASGNGGQYIFVLPAYNLVAVFTGHEYNNPAGGNGLRIFVERIIPAMN